MKRLLYRGSKDGFKGLDFHTKCDDQGKTLTVIKTQRGRVFGGFTDISWDSTGNPKTANGNTFLFLVQQDKSVLKFKYLNNGKGEI